MTILITGATGFVGSALVQCLSLQSERGITAAVRETSPVLPKVVKQVNIGGISSDTQWQQALHGVEVVIHLAARVHVMKDSAVDPLASFRMVNTAGTLNLARQAASAGVRRFIFLSTVKVNGEQTAIGEAFAPDDNQAPSDPYSVSKYEAEQGLQEIAAETGLEVVIIRPPLVYGAGVKGNFSSMIRVLGWRLPLPLGSIHNHRSLVAIDNLVDLIIVCTEHPSAANQIFMVSDGEDLSTTALLRRLADALGKPALLLPVPEKILNVLLALLRKPQVVQRLCGSLQVDISKTQRLLNWHPPVSIDTALKDTAQHWLSTKQ